MLPNLNFLRIYPCFTTHTHIFVSFDIFWNTFYSFFYIKTNKNIFYFAPFMCGISPISVLFLKLIFSEMVLFQSCFSFPYLQSYISIYILVDSWFAGFGWSWGSIGILVGDSFLESCVGFNILVGFPFFHSLFPCVDSYGWGSQMPIISR